MGKWLSRKIERGDFRNEISPDIPENHTDRTDRIPARINPETVLPSIDHLTETERLAFGELVEDMQGRGLDREEADCIAWQVIDRNKRTLQVQQAVKDYRKFGFIKIHSTVLGQCLYLVRDKKTAKQVPDGSLPVYTEDEVKSLKGLSREEARVLMEAKIIFNGMIGIKK